MEVTGRRRRMLPEPDAAMITVTDAERRMTETVKQHYVRERTVFETMRAGVNVVYRPPRRYDGLPPVITEAGVLLEKAVPSVWLKLARFFLTNRIDPIAYVRCQFDRASLLRHAPEPGQLMDQECMTSWQRVSVVRGREVVIALATQKEAAASQINHLQYRAKMGKEDSYVSVLVDEGLELSPLFRYCLAEQMIRHDGVDPVRVRAAVKGYEVLAVVQYERDKSLYERYWSDMVPRGFAHVAEVIYEYLFGRNDREETS